jgi:hypothetical protein
MWQWMMYVFVALAVLVLLVVCVITGAIRYHNYKVRRRDCTSRIPSPSRLH